ncbi:MAG TPA: site-2 protease family protein [Thermoanaerobaculia bacterium]|nr:site-2 protease family protein [Thermoanaerobaculia bacterium]
MDFLTTPLSFVIVLGVIIFVHEAGHLVVAKAFGVRVLAFSLGFGKRLFGFRRGETDYRVSLIPLGGYVRLGGENPDEFSDDPREFLNKPRWQRILVYLAGPAMNVVLAIAIMTVLFAVGTDVSGHEGREEAMVGMVAEGSPGAAAGLRPGDRLLAVDGKPIATWEDLAVGVSFSPGEPLALTVERGGERFTTTVVPEEIKPYGFGDIGVFPRTLPRVIGLEAGGPAERAGLGPGDEMVAVDGRPIANPSEFIQYIEEHAGEQVVLGIRRGSDRLEVPVVPGEIDGRGKIGVYLGSYARYPLDEALVQSLRFNWNITVRTLGVLSKIMTGEVSAKRAVSGPLDIASLSGAALQAGIDRFVYLVAIISLSIAIFNLLPIPLLDGGQIFILLVETVRRRDLSLVLKERIQQVGFVLILMLMAAVILMDLSKRLPDNLFGGG